MKRGAMLAMLVVMMMSLSAQSLNVASYNIRLHTKVDYKHNDGWQERRDVMCDLVAFAAFDIFGAQEVFHDQLMDMLERLPGYAHIGGARDDGGTTGEYSPIFYRKDRFEVLESGTFWISETPEEVSFGWDADCRRVCSWAYLKDKKTKKKFWYFNTHLDHKGVVAREEGAKLLIKKINEMCGDKARVILSGDFNTNQNSVPYGIITSVMADAYEASPVKFAPAGTFNNFNAKRSKKDRIDHVFVKGFDVKRYGILTNIYWSEPNTEASGKNGKIHLPSDHYPVQVWLDFD